MAVELIVGTNTYASIAEAGIYFSERLNADIWYNASADRKAQSMVMATRRIDRLRLKGRKANLGQILQFPRAFYSHGLSNLEYTDGYPSDGWTVEASIAQCVKDACCEEALSLLTGISKRQELQHQGVTSFTIGDLSESYKNMGTRLQSKDAYELLRPYLVGGVTIT